MVLRMCELKCREIINVSDGGRIGFVADIELDCTGGNVVALIVPGKAKLFGLLGREDDFVIPWNAIRRLGEDIILVEVELEKIRRPCKKRRNFF